MSINIICNHFFLNNQNHQPTPLFFTILMIGNDNYKSHCQQFTHKLIIYNEHFNRWQDQILLTRFLL
jgi:hypothetical protein